jgi:hypothetical protein
MRLKPLDLGGFHSNILESLVLKKMKRCLFFFLAFLLAVVLFALTEAPSVKKAEVNALANYSEVSNPEGRDMPVSWSADEQLNENRENQSSRTP